MWHNILTASLADTAVGSAHRCPSKIDHTDHLRRFTLYSGAFNWISLQSTAGPSRRSAAFTSDSLLMPPTSCSARSKNAEQGVHGKQNSHAPSIGRSHPYNQLVLLLLLLPHPLITSRPSSRKLWRLTAAALAFIGSASAIFTMTKEVKVRRCASARSSPRFGSIPIMTSLRAG